MLRLRVGFSGPVTVGVTKELRIEGIRPVAQVITQWHSTHCRDDALVRLWNAPQAKRSIL
jgi:hypothetical protein